MLKKYQNIHILDKCNNPIKKFNTVEISSIDFADDSFVLHFKDGDFVYMVDVPIKDGIKLLID